MDTNEMNKIRGQKLRELRDAKGLSREKLLEGSIDTISTKQLFRIENGISKLTPTAASLILPKFDLTLEAFEALCFGGDMKKFEDHFAKALHYGSLGQFDKKMGILALIKTQSYYIDTIPTMRQAMLMGEAVCISQVDGRHQEALSMLQEAIITTASKALKRNKTFDYKYIATHVFSLQEYRVFRESSTVMSLADTLDTSVKLQEATIASLSQDDVSIDIQKRLLPFAFFNLSNDLLCLNLFKRTLETMNTAFMFSKEHDITKTHHRLYWNQGRAYIGLNKKNEATVCFQKTVNLLKALEACDEAERLIQVARDKYDCKLIR